MCFAKNSCPFLNAMASIQQIAVQFRKVLGLYHQAMKKFFASQKLVTFSHSIFKSKVCK